jgi:hypothetical protein
MSDFGRDVQKALRFVTDKQLIAICLSSLNSSRNLLLTDLAKAVKSETGIKRSLRNIKKRLKFAFERPKIEGSKAIDKIDIDRPQFTFLAFKAKIANRKLPKKRRGKARRLSGSPKQKVLLAVTVGSKFKSYQGVFIAKGENEDEKKRKVLPFRRKEANRNRSPLEVMKVNALNIVINNDPNLQKAGKNYLDKLRERISKKILQRAKKEIERRNLKLKVGPKR